MGRSHQTYHEDSRPKANRRRSLTKSSLSFRTKLFRLHRFAGQLMRRELLGESAPKRPGHRIGCSNTSSRRQRLGRQCQSSNRTCKGSRGYALRLGLVAHHLFTVVSTIVAIIVCYSGSEHAFSHTNQEEYSNYRGYAEAYQSPDN